jgi:hypothetical protein
MPLRLTRRPDSTFWWVTGSVAGRRVRESTGTADRAAADEYRATREAAIYRSAIHGEPLARPTFAACVVSYLEHAGPHSAPTRARIKRILDELGPLTAADDLTRPALT